MQVSSPHPTFIFVQLSSGLQLSIPSNLPITEKEVVAVLFVIVSWCQKIEGEILLISNNVNGHFKGH
jgi:hypothetical protein